MAEKSTFIKIDRNIINWGWFKSPKVLQVFLWLLIKANVKPGHFEKDIIERGSFATSNAHIAEGCGLTIDNVRTALANLEDTGEIVRTVRNHYQIITVVNYEMYQTDVAKKLCQIPSNPDVKSRATAMSNPNNQRIKERKKERMKEPPKSPNGGLDSPSGIPARGTPEFRRISHLVLKRDEGTVDDIPEIYRKDFDNFSDYWGYKNQ